MQKINILSLLLITICLAGCVKNTDTFTEYVPIDNFFENPTDIPVAVSFDASQSFSYLSPDNVLIEVPAGALIDDQGEAVSGSVELHLAFLQGIGDLIQYNFNTEGLYGLLDAHAVIHLSFEQDGKSLNRSSDAPITVYLPYDTPQSKAVQHTLSDGGWLPSVSTTTNAVEVTEYNILPEGQQLDIKGYKLTPTTLGWINVAIPLEANDGVYTICAELPQNHNNVNSVVYGSLDRYTSLLTFKYDKEKILFCGEIVNINSDQEIRLIAISAQGAIEEYNFGTKSAILDSSSKEIVTLSPKSRQEIFEYLESM